MTEGRFLVAVRPPFLLLFLRSGGRTIHSVLAVGRRIWRRQLSALLCGPYIFHCYLWTLGLHRCIVCTLWAAFQSLLGIAFAC